MKSKWEIKLQGLQPSALIFALRCLRGAKKVNSDEGMGIIKTHRLVQVDWKKNEINEADIISALLEHLRHLGYWAINSESYREDIPCMAGVVEQQGDYPCLGEEWHFEYTHLLEPMFSVEPSSYEPDDGYIRFELISKVRVKREDRKMV